jgi:hypothetical protein
LKKWRCKALFATEALPAPRQRRRKCPQNGKKKETGIFSFPKIYLSLNLKLACSLFSPDAAVGNAPEKT